MSDQLHDAIVQMNGHAEEDSESLYQQVCDALETERHPGESVEDFKIRLVTEFSDMSQWPDDKYEMLSKDLQDWIYDATTTHKANITKKRKKTLPVLTGLDPAPAEKTKKRGRASLNDEPKVRGRTRTSGDDCLTRTMKYLVTHSSPDTLKAADLVKTLEAQYGKEYSTAAVRYAQQAFLTARTLINHNNAAE